MSASESAIEAYLLDLVPELAADKRGASDEQIQQIEALAREPLPEFYRWFLRTFGGASGRLGPENVEFSAQKILELHSNGEVAVPARLLLVGIEREDASTLHYFYDLSLPARDDARILRMDLIGRSRTDVFETFRELLAWTNANQFHIDTRAFRCKGSLTAEDTEVLAKLSPVLAGLGFHEPIATGPGCAVYERKDATLLCKVTPDSLPCTFETFRLAADDEASMLTILGALSEAPGLRLNVNVRFPKRAAS